MSTTFGIYVPSLDEVVPIARRIGIGNGDVNIYFINQLAEILPDETEVQAMDNSPQWIYTLGDIRKKIHDD